MGEFLKRMKADPSLTGQMLVATVLCNILALASPLFVMQVLNRYVSHGVDSTLATLAGGTLTAVLMEFLFRQVRHSMAKELNAKHGEEATLAGFAALVHGKITALERIPAGKRREIVNGAQDIESTYNAQNIGTLLDLPFSVLFLFILFLLSPMLSLVATFFIGGIFLYALLGAISVRNTTDALRTSSSQSSGILETAIREMDTVHAFNAQAYLKKAWFEVAAASQDLRATVSTKQNVIQTMTQSGTAVMSVFIISIGAILAVAGELDTGALIGANILATRAMQPTQKFAQMGATLEKAKQSLKGLEEFVQMPLEPDQGTAKAKYTGSVEFRDVAFFFPGSTGPLFESLDIKIEPGNVIVAIGNSGTGKTTLARLLVGLLEPIRGQILVDGMDLRQVAPEWWRQQIVYLPQEPTFLNASIADNLMSGNADANLERVNLAVDLAGIRSFIDESPQGFETPIAENGRQLAVGVRRGLALARALMSNGRFVIIDEMFDGFDPDGRAAVNRVVNGFVKEGRTVIIMSHKANMNKGVTAAIDLNIKPKPRVTFFSEHYRPDMVHASKDKKPADRETDPGLV